ncbi:receptor-like protein kinase FERONIA [Rhododendron vialii]|uniref:receptor-like protein kinase FERONIA n=1 Tax=Rhododendron vialii TaxID=182163 RepID=UPI00265EBB1F|nr:receptor-like protein kinase FERONIA [Rhododendron vialii]
MDLSNGNSVSRNETKVSDVLPSSDPALPGTSYYLLLISKSQNRIDCGVIQSEGSCRRFTLDEVLLATDNFHDALVIGKGGFGKVYKGFIDDGATTTVVAIKRLNAQSNQGAEEFWTEVKLLSNFHHINLVSLIGYCNENQEMILVYDYIARGTLASHLYKSSRKESGKSISHLNWTQRLNICLGVARALDYLHTGTEQHIIHRDVKSTNILLDKNWVAKVSDFGICKLITSQTTTHVSTKVKATRGYWDPNYIYTNRVTRKSDVYAFGVVLLEVLCGRPPLDDRLEEEQISLILWAKMYIEKGKLDPIIDPSIKGETTPHSLKYFAKLANNCLHAKPKKRPTMSEVVEILEIALASHEHKGRSQETIAKTFQGMNRWWRARKGNGSNDVGEPILDDLTQSLYQHFSLAGIRAATNDFNNDLLISEDSSFRLYKGCMVGGTRAVIIKRYKSGAVNLAVQVSSEIGVQSLPRHPNIDSLIGICEEKDELILVYDYMVNGTLKSHLHRSYKDSFLWKKRLEICINIARGLESSIGM